MKYYSLRRFDSDCHIFEWHPSKNPSQIVFAKDGKREKLSQITHNWFNDNNFKEMAKVNFSFFVMSNPNSQFLGALFHDSGFVKGQPNVGMECYLTKDGKFVVEDLDNTKSQSLKGKVAWGGSLSYSLIINGQKDIRNTTPFPHYRERHPRTLFGQKADGTMMIVTVDGRSTSSKGVTADQSAEIMLELGCINAISGDGGGSTHLIVEDKTANKPSENRSLGTALVVYGKEGDKVERFEPSTPSPTPINPSTNTLKISIDAGHGLETPGKRTPDDSMREHHFNSVVAKHVIEQLSQYENVETITTHSDSKDVSLKERTDKANNWNADLFLSIHANAFGETWNDANGIETLVYKRGIKAEDVANVVQRELIKHTGRRDRGVKVANFHVLRETKMPAILVECGFMTNREEAELLKSDEYRRKCATAIVNGLAEHYKLKKKEVTPPAPENPNKLFRVQIGAFGVKSNAENLKKELEFKGYKPIIVEV